MAHPVRIRQRVRGDEDHRPDYAAQAGRGQIRAYADLQGTVRLHRQGGAQLPPQAQVDQQEPQPHHHRAAQPHGFGIFCGQLGQGGSLGLERLGPDLHLSQVVKAGGDRLGLVILLEGLLISVLIRHGRNGDGGLSDGLGHPSWLLRPVQQSQDAVGAGRPLHRHQKPHGHNKPQGILHQRSGPPPEDGPQGGNDQNQDGRCDQNRFHFNSSSALSKMAYSSLISAFVKLERSTRELTSRPTLP